MGAAPGGRPTWPSPARPGGGRPAAWCWNPAVRPSRGPHRPVPGGRPGPPFAAPPGSPRCPAAPGAARPVPRGPRPAVPAASRPEGEWVALGVVEGHGPGSGCSSVLGLGSSSLEGEAGGLSSWWRLISFVFLTRTSCPKTTHANSYYGAWAGWVVSVSVLPLTKPHLSSAVL